MADKKRIQFPRYVINKQKNEAIAKLTEYVNLNIDEFEDGEVLTLRYLDPVDNISLCSCNVVVDKNDEERFASLSVQIGEYDTLKIIEKDGNNPPADRNTLWLSDFSEEEGKSGNIREELRELRELVKCLKQQLDCHEYAIKNAIGGGELTDESVKYKMETEFEQEYVEEAPNPYDTEHPEINAFGVYYGDLEINNASWYDNKVYFLRLRAFNDLEKTTEVSPLGCTLKITCPEGGEKIDICPSEITIDNTGITQQIRLSVIASGDVTIVASLTKPDGTKLDNIVYLLSIEHGEKPDYPCYQEPCTGPVLIKRVATIEELTKNQNYLEEGEFCWCVEDRGLYLRVRTDKSGSLQLFKINGGGYIPTGSTIAEYAIDDNDEIIATTYDGTIYISEDDELTLVGTIDENGTLILTTPVTKTN